jgi:hypothetical protein
VAVRQLQCLSVAAGKLLGISLLLSRTAPRGTTHIRKPAIMSA